MERRYWFLILTGNVLFISFNTVDTSCSHFQVINGDVLIVSSQVPEANVYCDDGYQLVGVSRLFCLSGNWNDTLPKCLIDCGAPVYDSVVMAAAYTTSVEGSLAYFTCHAGRVMISGNGTSTCLATGQWSQLPECVYDCKSLQHITNGYVTHLNGTKFKSTALYSCDLGYTITGTEYRSCLTNGSWSGSQPACNIVDCMSLWNITNGFVTHLNGTTFQSAALYSCDLGYAITGTEYRSCLANGSWSGSQPACNVVDCKSLQNIKNGYVTHLNGTTFKSTALYSCNLGYTITGGEYRVCLASGSWSGSQPACLVVDCRSLLRITNGNVTHLNGTTFNSMALYSCDLGYNITGTEFRSCLANGSWSGSQPACHIVDCKTLQNMSNGIVTHPNGTTFQSAALYSCDLGFTIYDSEYRTCSANGSWSGSQPSCNIVDCKSLQNIANGKVTHLNGTTFKSVALYSCNLGYTITGNEYPTCLANGSWSGSQPYCNIVDCKSLQNITNGIVTHLNGTTFKSVALYSCDLGYSFTGTEVRTCLADGSWGGSQPACNVVDCKSLKNITNGYVTYLNGTTFKSATIYSCDLGYTITGTEFRSCLANGSWSGSQPACNIVDCKSLQNMSNGIVIHLNGTTFKSAALYSYCRSLQNIANGKVTHLNGTTTFISVALYSCDLGYLASNCKLSNNSSIKSDSCYCKSLQNIPNGSVTHINGTTFQSVALHSCDMGYTINGTEIRTCLANGSWSGSKPYCNIVDCTSASLQNISNGNVTLINGTTFKSVAIYACDSGYTIKGTEFRMCLDNGSWSGSKPSCSIVGDSAVTCPEDLDARGTTWPNTRAGETVIKPCLEIYTGNITRTCSNAGDWKKPLYFCIRRIVSDAQAKVQGLGPQSPEEDIVAAVKQLSEAAILSTSSDPATTCTDAEVLILSTSLEDVAELVPNNTDRVTDDFLETASTLIDQYNKVSWQTLEYYDSAGADKVMDAVDTLAMKSNTTDKPIVKKNLAYEKRQSGVNELQFPVQAEYTWLIESKSSISVNTSLGGEVTSFGVIYNNMTGIIGANDENGGAIVNGPVVSMTILSSQANLLAEVTVIIEHSVKTGFVNPNCTFWKTRSDSARSYWSTEGCSVLSSNATLTICKCNHLTNFAVLMSPFVPGEVDSVALRVVSLVGIGISMLCLLITLVTHFCLWRFVRSDRVSLLMNLCAALLVAYVAFLAGIDRTESKGVCIFITSVLHYIYLVVFSLMLAEGIDICLSVVFVFSKRRRIRYLIICAWVLPAITVGISLGITKTMGYGNDKYCWLSIDNGLIWAFVGPALAVIGINLIFLVIAIYKLFHVQTMKQKTKIDQIRTSARSLCVLIPLMGISWIIGIFYVKQELYWMQYAFAVCNGLQGFFIFLFHCVFNTQIRKAVKARNKKLSTTKLTSTLKSTLRNTSRASQYQESSPDELSNNYVLRTSSQSATSTTA